MPDKNKYYLFFSHDKITYTVDKSSIISKTKSVFFSLLKQLINYLFFLEILN